MLSYLSISAARSFVFEHSEGSPKTEAAKLVFIMALPVIYAALQFMKRIISLGSPDVRIDFVQDVTNSLRSLLERQCPLLIEFACLDQLLNRAISMNWSRLRQRVTVIPLEAGDTLTVAGMALEETP